MFLKRRYVVSLVILDDFLYAGNSSNDQMLFVYAAKKRGLRYTLAPSLRKLQSYLEENRAKTYIIDDSVSSLGQCSDVENVKSALEIIARCTPHNHVVIFGLYEDVEALAEERNIEYFSKTKYAASEMLEKLLKSTNKSEQR